MGLVVKKELSLSVTSGKSRPKPKLVLKESSNLGYVTKYKQIFLIINN